MYLLLLLLGTVLAQVQEKPRLDVTMGVTIDPVPGAVLYTNSIPLFVNINGLPEVNFIETGEERYCGYNQTAEENETHTAKNAKELSTSQGLCALTHQAFKIMEVNKNILRSIDDMHDSEHPKDRFRRDSKAKLKRQKRVPLFEPLGNLLEIITGNPSAATFREVAAHINYLEKFNKRLLKTQATLTTDFIKIVDSTSRTRNDTIEGFIELEHQIESAHKSFDLLQGEYNSVELAVLNSNMVLVDSQQLHYRTLSHLWIEHARAQCLRKKIPRALISPKELEEHLRDIVKLLDEQNYKLSVPDYENEIYYKINLCDCTWERRIGVIRLQIPIISQRSNWQLYRVQTVPYAYFNKTCYVDIPSTLVAVDGTKVIPFEEHDLDKCKIQDDFLCQIPRYGMKHSMKNTCLKKLVGGSDVEEIQKICPVQCHVDTKPSITMVAPRHFIVTNLGKNDGVIKCPGANTNLEGPAVGALSIKIPCNCQLLIGTVRQDEDSFPCVRPELKTVEWNHTLPAMFANKWPTVKVAANQPILVPVDVGISGIMDIEKDMYATGDVEEKVKESLDKLDIDNKVKIAMLNTEEPEWMQRNFNDGYTVVYVWLMLLTIVNVAILYFYRPMPIPNLYRAGIPLTTMIPGSSGATTNEACVCSMPFHVEVLLWTYLVWTVLFMLPFVVSFIHKQWEHSRSRKALAAQMKQNEKARAILKQANKQAKKIQAAVDKNMVVQKSKQAKKPTPVNSEQDDSDSNHDFP